MADYKNIHYSCSGSDTEVSHWALCVNEYDDDKTYVVTKDMTRVHCKDCKTKMPQIFSVLHKFEGEITVIANILARDRDQAIQVVVHFIDNGEMKSLDGKGVNLFDIKLVRSTTSTFSN